MSKKEKPQKIHCPYCGGTAILKKATEVYQEKALEEFVYVCSNYPACNSYVGVHAGSLRPKGTLANGDLRHKRIVAHRYFDCIWKNKIMNKRDAYHWIQDSFGLNSSQAHIGQFSDYMCEQLIIKCRKVLENNQIAC